MLEKMNPWMPTSDPLDLKVLGKLAEESAELGSAVARCIVQGIEESEPTTGKPNRQWLQEELADVLTMIAHAIRHFDLDEKFLKARVDNKYERLQTWFDMEVKEVNAKDNQET